MDTGNVTDIYFKSKIISLAILAATSLICSRALFFFFDDPQGPNVLVVSGLAMIILFISALAYLFVPFKLTGIKRLALIVCIQILSVGVLYFLMK